MRCCAMLPQRLQSSEMFTFLGGDVWLQSNIDRSSEIENFLAADELLQHKTLIQA